MYDIYLWILTSNIFSFRKLGKGKLPHYEGTIELKDVSPIAGIFTSDTTRGQDIIRVVGVVLVNIYDTLKFVRA